MPELAVQWLEKKFKKYESKFYNTKEKCCANPKVKDFVQKRNLYDFTATNQTNNDKTKATTESKSTDATKLVEGMSLIHVYFKELEVLKYSKQENYAAIDLIGKLYCSLGPGVFI